MPLQSTLANARNGLCLLSLDAGGARSISQLKILAELMHRVNFGVVSDPPKRPCDVFDMITGVGSGGFIAILLVALGLNADEALEEFIKLSVDILEKLEMDSEARTAALKQHISELLKKHNIMENMKLLDSNDFSKTCKLVIPVAYRHQAGSKCILRNFESRQEQAVNLAIAEAMLATLATPPLFTSMTISKDSATFEYIGGDLSLSNPTTELISQGYEAFGPERQVACVLSIGCGHPGVISTPDGSDRAKCNQFLEAVVMDSEQKAQAIDVQMGHLGLYHRFHVERGLERSSNSEEYEPGRMITHTSIYLTNASISRKMDICVDLLKLRDGISSLEQLKRSGGPPVLASALPPLTKTFVMRKEPWEFAEKALLGPRDLEEDDGQRILIVTGIGGCGKTQLMVKFLRVHSARFISSCFVDGSSEARIRADIVRYVRSLEAMYSQMNFDDCLLILSHASPERPRIVLYDNVDDPAIDIAPLLPNGDGCSIIITSRNHFIGTMSPDTHLELDKMSMDEAVQLLLYSPNRFDSVADQTLADARTVAEALDCLPIALQQARSYMRETGCSTRAYLERLRTSRDKILAHKVKYQREMRYLSTYAAFDASFGKLYPRTQQFLQLLSFLHWHKFPLELVILAARHNFSDYEDEYVDQGDFHRIGSALLKDIFLVEGAWDLTNLDELTTDLQNYSLITLVPGVGTTLLEMHPLLHAWVHSSISENNRAEIESAAIVLLTLGARSDYTPCGQYLSSHVMHLSPCWDGLCTNESTAFGVILASVGLYQGALQLQEKAVAWLRQESSEVNVRLLGCISKLADTYQASGKLDKALALQEETLMQYEELVGKQHPDTIRVSNDLASIYYDLGRFGEALVLTEEVLKLRREILGEHHPTTTKVLGDLASMYSALGRLKEALDLKEEVLRRNREKLGERHPDTIESLSSLAYTYSTLGRLKEALVLDEEVPKLRRDILGERHPGTIRALNNLASRYSDLGRFDEALVLQEQVLKLRKEILGERHPDTIGASNNLASTYSKLGRAEEALVLLEEVLRLSKEVLGERHPSIITASSNVTSTYSGLGRFDEALVLEEEMLKLSREVLGERHPDTIRAANNVASTYSSLGRIEEALVVQEEVMTLTREILGEHHRGTITASFNLASTYSKLGRFDEALVLKEQVRKLSSEIFGERHPDTIMASSSLASTYSNLGRFDEALVLDQEVLQLRRETLEEHHPDTIEASIKLASTYSDLGRLDEALVLEEEILRLRREILGERHPDTITSSHNLASRYSDLGRVDEALVLREEVLKLSRNILGERHPITIMASSNLASTYSSIGRIEEAVVLQEQVLKLVREISGEFHPNTIMASSNLASTYINLGRSDEALALKEQARKLSSELLGERNPTTITASNDLASMYSDLKRFDEALALRKEVLQLHREILGEKHPDTIDTSIKLASTYSDLGRLKEALVIQEEVLRLHRETLSERDPNAIAASGNLAHTYFTLERFDEALVLQEEVLELSKEILGDQHPGTIVAANNLSITYSKLGSFEKAAVLMEEVLKGWKEVLGQHHPVTIRSSNNLASAYAALGRLGEALILLEEVLRLQKQQLGDQHPETCEVMLNIAVTYANLNRLSDALDLLNAADAIILEKLGNTHALYQRCQDLRSQISSE